MIYIILSPWIEIRPLSLTSNPAYKCLRNYMLPPYPALWFKLRRPRPLLILEPPPSLQIITAQSLTPIGLLPPVALIRDFTEKKKKTPTKTFRCNRQIGSKSTNHSPLAWLKEGQKVTLLAVIGGSNLSITRKTEGNLGKVVASVLIS